MRSVLIGIERVLGSQRLLRESMIEERDPLLTLWPGELRERQSEIFHFFSRVDNGVSGLEGFCD